MIEGIFLGLGVGIFSWVVNTLIMYRVLPVGFILGRYGGNLAMCVIYTSVVQNNIETVPYALSFLVTMKALFIGWMVVNGLFSSKNLPLDNETTLERSVEALG